MSEYRKTSPDDLYLVTLKVGLIYLQDVITKIL